MLKKTFGIFLTYSYLCRHETSYDIGCWVGNTLETID